MRLSIRMSSVYGKYVVAEMNSVTVVYVMSENEVGSSVSDNGNAVQSPATTQ